MTLRRVKRELTIGTVRPILHTAVLRRRELVLIYKGPHIAFRVEGRRADRLVFPHA